MVAEQNQAFEQLSRDIRGHLSASRSDALPDAPTYSVRVSDLAEAVRQIRVEATNRFATLQERYCQALINQLAYPPTQLYQLHQYNPVAPQDSYARLRDDVRQMIRDKVCQQLQQRITNEQKAIGGTLQSPLFATLPPSDQAQLREQGVVLINQLNSLQTQLDAVVQQTGDSAVINDFPEDGNGRFPQLLQTLRQIIGALKEIAQQVNHLSAHLTELKLTPEEEGVNQVLQGEPKDLSTLRQLTPKLSEEAFCKALSGLSAKRRVNILVSPVRYD